MFDICRAGLQILPHQVLDELSACFVRFLIGDTYVVEGVIAALARRDRPYDGGVSAIVGEAVHAYQVLEDKLSQQGPITENTRFRRLATAAAIASLFSFAALLFITPACNNEISTYYKASLSQLSWLPLAMTGGFFGAVLWAGGYSDRHGKLPALAMGCTAMCAGSVVFSQTTNFNVAVAAVMLIGIGGGLSEGTAMALICDLYGGPRRTAVANMAQAIFSLGAVASPLIAGCLIRMGVNWRYGYVATAAVCAASAALVIGALAMRVEEPVGARECPSQWRALLSDRLVLLLGIGILLYVGAEMGQSTWLSVYFKREIGSSGATAAWSLSLMWLGLAIGRLSINWVAKRSSEMAIINWSMGLAAASQAALLLARDPVSALVSSFLLGVFLGPVFPTVVSHATSIHPRQSGTVTAIVVACGSVGVGVFSPLIGLLADGVGIRAALWVCFGLLLLGLGLFLRTPAAGTKSTDSV